jgi:hypothetical protein
LSKPEDDSCSEGGGGKKGLCASVVTGCDAAPVLKPTKHDLDPVTAFVVADGLAARLPTGNALAYPIRFFHVYIAEVQTAEGKLYLFVGIDRTAKFAVAQLVSTADRKTAWEFPQYMLEAVPYQVHTILIDNGIQFAEQPRHRDTIYSRRRRFDIICEANGIVHHLLKPKIPGPTVRSSAGTERSRTRL